MLLPFLSLGCGIIFASLGLGLWGGTSAIISGVIIYFFIIHLSRNPIKAFRYAYWHYVWLSLIFIGIGVVVGDFSRFYQPNDKEIKDAVIVEGMVKDIRNLTSGDLLTVEVQSLYNKEGIRRDYSNFKVECYSDAVSVSEGDLIAFPAKGMKKIEDSPNSFHKGYAEAKAKQGIYYNQRVAGNQIRKIGHDRFFISGIAKSMRDAIVAFIEKQALQRNTKNFIITLLSGDRAYLDPEVRQTFANAGIAHVLALSGMHIAIIAGIFLSILFPLNFLGKYKLRYFLTALLLWFYAFITGMSPSIIRACVMASAFIIAMILERKNTAFNSLCLAGFIILLFSPYAMYEIGFQLSFLCVASLILFAGRLNPIDHRHHPRLYNLCGLVLASLIATFSSWIVVAYYFQTFPTLFLPANIIILPVLPFYVSGIILYLFLELCGIHIELLAKAIDSCYDLFVSIISFFGNETVLHLSVPGYSVFLWLLGVIFIALSIWKVRTWRIKPFYISIVSALFIFSSLLLTYLYEPKMERGFIICNSYPELRINVSDGRIESFLEIPKNALSMHQINKKSIIILDFDTIPKIENLNKIDLLKISRIDYLIVTRKYKGDIARIKEIFNPKQIVTHSSMRKKRESELIEEALKLNIPVHSLRHDNALKVVVE